jgi:hypothetical protein
MKRTDKREIIERAVIVSSDDGGIIPYCEAFYIESILYAAGRAKEAFERYESMLKQEIEPAYLISIIQEAVGHAAALSRFFWPSGIGFKEPKEIQNLRENRGIKLRKSFGLLDTSPLMNRSLRNAWEHFDERLDKFLLQNDAGFFFPSALIGSHTLADDPMGKIFKLLDQDEGCLVLLGEKYFFRPIKEEVLRIFDHAVFCDKHGGRLKKAKNTYRGCVGPTGD